MFQTHLCQMQTPGKVLVLRLICNVIKHTALVTVTNKSFSITILLVVDYAV